MRLRLILAFIFIVLLTASLVLLVAVRQTAVEVRRFVLRGGIQGIEQHVTALEVYYRSSGSWQGAEKVLRAPGPGNQMRRWGLQIGAIPTIQAPPVTLADAEGRVVAVSDPQERVQGLLSSEELSRAVPLEVNGETVGYLLPENAMNITPRISRVLLARLNRVAITAALVAGAAAILVALLLAQNLLRPIRQLTRAASQLAKGDLSGRVEVQRSDELATLGRAFNRMAESLEAAEKRRRDMTADIAHELRNPLAVQRAHLEALQDGVYPLSLGSLDPIEEQNRLLTRLVEDLRTLALADAGKLELERTPTDLYHLGEKVVARFQPQASAQGIDIRISQQDDPLILLVDPQRIEQILNNLLSNALRYSPRAGTISVEIKAARDAAHLTVHDGGPGILEEDLPYIFERFYKTDKSRSRSESGTGLGLSIARKLAQAHGGDLTAENHPQGGALFRLSLPLLQGGEEDSG